MGCRWKLEFNIANISRINEWLNASRLDINNRNSKFNPFEVMITFDNLLNLI